MRSGEGTRYGGYDGTFKAERGNAFVPDGLSAWEMGVDPRPKKKADDDYKKRTAKPLDVDPSQATFVFVTPHRWPGKENWAAEKRQAGPASLVDVLGGFGVKLERGEHYDLRLGHEVACLLQRLLHLPLFEGGVGGTEADDRPLVRTR